MTVKLPPPDLATMLRAAGRLHWTQDAADSRIAAQVQVTGPLVRLQGRWNRP
jgi:hypothetical protein